MIDLEYYQVPEIKKVISSLDIQTVSSPVLTNYGYHLVWVKSVEEGGVPTLDKNWLALKDMALNKKKADWYSTWISNVKQNFYIKRNELTYPQIGG